MVVRNCLLNLGKQIVHCRNVDPITRQQLLIHTTSVRSELLIVRSIPSYPRERRMSPPWKHCRQIGKLQMLNSKFRWMFQFDIWILHFHWLGDPVLRQVATDVPIEYIRENQAELKALLKNMEQVLHDSQLVGIAAPQIGVSLRIFLMEFQERTKELIPPELYKAREMATMPLTVRRPVKLTNANDEWMSTNFSQFPDSHQSSNKGHQFRKEGVSRRLCQHLRLHGRCSAVLWSFAQRSRWKWCTVREAVERMERTNRSAWNGSSEWAIVRRYYDEEIVCEHHVAGSQQKWGSNVYSIFPKR